MAKIEHTVEIDRPPSDVFRYLVESDKVPQWQETLVELRPQSAGPVDVGTTMTEVRRFMGRRIESRLEVTAYEPERRFDLKTTAGPIPFAVRHTLHPVEGGTRLEIVGEAEGAGFFRMAEGLVTRQARRQFVTDFARLKDLLEGRR